MKDNLSLNLNKINNIGLINEIIFNLIRKVDINKFENEYNSIITIINKYLNLMNLVIKDTLTKENDNNLIRTFFTAFTEIIKINEALKTSNIDINNTELSQNTLLTLNENIKILVQKLLKSVFAIYVPKIFDQSNFCNPTYNKLNSTIFENNYFLHKLSLLKVLFQTYYLNSSQPFLNSFEEIRLLNTMSLYSNLNHSNNPISSKLIENEVLGLIKESSSTFNYIYYDRNIYELQSKLYNIDIDNLVKKPSLKETSYVDEITLSQKAVDKSIEFKQSMPLSIRGFYMKESTHYNTEVQPELDSINEVNLLNHYASKIKAFTAMNLIFESIINAVGNTDTLKQVEHLLFTDNKSNLWEMESIIFDYRKIKSILEKKNKSKKISPNLISSAIKNNQTDLIKKDSSHNDSSISQEEENTMIEKEFKINYFKQLQKKIENIINDKDNQINKNSNQQNLRKVNSKNNAINEFLKDLNINQTIINSESFVIDSKLIEDDKNNKIAKKMQILETKINGHTYLNQLINEANKI